MLGRNGPGSAAGDVPQVQAEPAPRSQRPAVRTELQVAREACGGQGLPCRVGRVQQQYGAFERDRQPLSMRAGCPSSV